MKTRVFIFALLLAITWVATVWTQQEPGGPTQLPAPVVTPSPTPPGSVYPAPVQMPPPVPPTAALMGLDTTFGNLKPFGYDYFQGQTPQVTEGPMDEDYPVSPRDELLIQTWGDYTKQFPVRVSEEGYIDLESEEKRVFVNGLTLGQVKEEVTKQLAQIHETIFNAKDPSAAKAWVEVKAIRVRPILVYVAGEVVRPGTYSMNATVASLLNILTNAGGIKATGSLRHLRVSRAATVEKVTLVGVLGTTRTMTVRTGETKSENYDLYDFLIRGETAPVKTRLKYGDTLFVDLKRKSVAIRGLIQRPGIYEMLDNESLTDLLKFAGGPSPGAYLKRIQVIRRALNQNLRALDVDYSSMNDAGTTFSLLDGDIVELFPSVGDEYIVRVDGGGVYRTGFFEYRDGMTLTDLIDKSEGLRGEAYLERADLVRTRMDYTKEYRSFPLGDLYEKNTETGRITLKADKTNPANFPIRRLDWITIYSYYEIIGKDKKVYLEGHVKQPGEHLLAEKIKLSDLLFGYGGFDDPDFRRATYQDRAELVRTRPEDLSTSLITISLRRILEGDKGADMYLQSMDRIHVFSYDEIKRKDKFVYLEGHIKRPGRQLMNENMRLSDLLFAYGGFEDLDFRKSTYLERADIFRTDPNDLSVQVLPVPLGKVLSGDGTADLPLQSLDRVVVYEYKAFYPDNYFNISGAVRVPGRYLLAKNATLNDALVMASGLKDEAYKYEAEIVRTLPSEVTPQAPAQVIRVPISENYAIEPRDKAVPLVRNDEVFVRTVPGWEKNRTVKVAGEVRFPGLYILARADERISDLVNRAGGLKDTAYMMGTLFQRRLDEKTTSSERTRMTIDLKQALARPQGPADVILRHGDELSVPINPMTVEVRGAVHVSAVLSWQSGADISRYVKLCGGFKEEARKRDVLVLNPDGTTTRRGWGVFEPVPKPGSVIIVPPYKGLLPGQVIAETTPTLAAHEVPLYRGVHKLLEEEGTTAPLKALAKMPVGPTLLAPGPLTPESGSFPFGRYGFPPRKRVTETTETRVIEEPTSFTLPPLRLPIP